MSAKEMPMDVPLPPPPFARREGPACARAGNWEQAGEQAAGRLGPLLYLFPGYLLLLVAAETLTLRTAPVGPAVGPLLYGLVLGLLLLHAALCWDRPFRCLPLTLSLAPLTRLLLFWPAVRRLPGLEYGLALGLPLLAVVVAAGSLALPLGRAVGNARAAARRAQVTPPGGARHLCRSGPTALRPRPGYCALPGRRADPARAAELPGSGAHSCCTYTNSGHPPPEAQARSDLPECGAARSAEHGCRREPSAWPDPSLPGLARLVPLRKDSGRAILSRSLRTDWLQRPGLRLVSLLQTVWARLRAWRVPPIGQTVWERLWRWATRVAAPARRAVDLLALGVAARVDGAWRQGQTLGRERSRRDHVSWVGWSCAVMVLLLLTVRVGVAAIAAGQAARAAAAPRALMVGGWATGFLAGGSRAVAGPAQAAKEPPAAPTPAAMPAAAAAGNAARAPLVVAEDRPPRPAPTPVPPPPLLAPTPVPTFPAGCPAGGYENIYPWGVCTWYAKAMRPDLPWFWEDWGMADNWGAAARACGFVVNEEPAPGAVIVFPPAANGAGPRGHVGYVEEVGENYVLFSECNASFDSYYSEAPRWWEGGYPCIHRRIPRDALDPGIEYIHSRAATGDGTPW